MVGVVTHFSIAGSTPVRAHTGVVVRFGVGVGVLLGIAGSTPVRLAYRSRGVVLVLGLGVFLNIA